MITTEGKNYIKRYLAGYVPSLAQSIAFGVGSRAEALTDTALQLETANAQINLTTFDFSTNKLIYKASVPENYVGKIYEVGIYSMLQDPTSSDFSSRTLTTFDSATESWVNSSTGADATYGSTSTRVGADSLLFSPAASATLTYALRNIELDLGGYSGSDSFTFAFNVANAFTSAIRIRLLTDSTNYYDFNLGAQTAGYKIVEAVKSSASVTGAPDWSNITEIQVTVTSTSGGTSGVEFEAIRVENKDSVSLDYILIARTVLASPVTKVEGQPQEIEFSLDVNL